MVFRAVVAVVLLICATVEGQGGVSFWRDKVTLTCPGKGRFYEKENKNNITSEQQKYDYEYSGGKDLYYCQYKDNMDSDKEKKYFFYVQGKACPNCFELDALLFAGVIVADVIGTVIVMVIIYKCTKKRAPGAPKHANNTAARSRGEEIPISPYEALNPRTRSNDTYSTVINKMG